jgi:hypothetical protein
MRKTPITIVTVWHFSLALGLFVFSGCFSGFDAPTCNELADCPLSAKACHAGYCISDSPTQPSAGNDIGEGQDAHEGDKTETCTHAEGLDNCSQWVLDLEGIPLGQPTALNQALFTMTLKEDGPFLQAIDVIAGMLSWEIPLSIEAPTCLLVHEGSHIVVSGDNGFCYVTQTGEQSECWLTDGFLSGCPAVLPGGQILVALTSAEGLGEAVVLEDITEAWRHSLNAPPAHSPIYVEGAIAIPLNNETIQLLSPLDGTPIKTAATPGDFTGNLAGDANGIWFLSQTDQETTLHSISATEEGGDATVILPFSPTGLVLLPSSSTALLPAIDGHLHEVSVASPSAEPVFTEIAIGGSLSQTLIADDESRLILNAQSGSLMSFLQNGNIQWNTKVGNSGGLGKTWMTLSKSWVLITTEGGFLHGIEVPDIVGPSTMAPWPMIRKNEYNVGG